MPQKTRHEKRKQRASTTARPADEKQIRWWQLAIGLLAVVPYLNALGNNFVLDDLYVVVSNPLIRDLGSAVRIFTTDYWSGTGAAGGLNDPGLYRPLSVWSFSVDYQLWGLAPSGYHAVNVLLHAIASIVVFRIALRLMAEPVAAFITAALFAVQPIHTEAVIGIVGRSDLLATAFFSLALLVSLSSGSLKRAVAAAALYLLALFSKEIAATFPLVLLLYDGLYREPWLAERKLMMRRLAIRYGPLFVAAGLYLVARQAALSRPAQMWVGFTGVSADDRILTAIRVFAEYVGLFLFPRTLLAEYSTATVPIAHSFLDARVLLALLLCSAIAALLIRFRRDRVLLFGAGLFLITLAPISNILFPIGVAKAERILYLPSIGLCLLAGWAAGAFARKAQQKWLVPAVAGAVIIALAGRTYARSRDWRDQMTLALATIRDAPASPMMNDIAGVELAKSGAIDRALPYFARAVQEEPKIAAYQTHLGTAYFYLGDLATAQGYLREAVRLRPDDGNAHNVLGAIHLQHNQLDSAVVELTTALRLNPGDGAAHANLGQALLNQGKLDDAQRELKTAIQLAPNYAQAHYDLGVVFKRTGNLTSARDEFRETLRLQPTHAQARASLDSMEQRTPK